MKTKAIILAAGRGIRMASYSNMGPKCLLEFKGEILLSRQLNSFTKAGITEFYIIGGYMIEQMKVFVQNSDKNINLIYNPFYAQMNSIGSLWFAREYLEGDVFITNADTFFDKSIYLKLLENNNNYVFGVDESKKNDADYRVTVSDGKIIDMGKDIPENETKGEYIGIALIRKEGIELFRNLLEKTINSGNYNLWWEDLFIELLAKNQKISYVNITGDLWFEIDEVRDYRKCQRYF